MHPLAVPALLALLLAGCQRSAEPQPMPATARPLPPKLPVEYTILPHGAELTSTVGNITYRILAVRTTSHDAWSDCVIDSIVVLTGSLGDSIYRLHAVFHDIEGTCLSTTDTTPPLTVETVGGRSFPLLIAHTWSGGNGGESFGMVIWSLNPPRRVAELVGTPRLLRLGRDSLLVAVGYGPFWPDEWDGPRALLMYIPNRFFVLEPTVDSKRAEEVWREFLQMERHAALRAYDSLLHTEEMTWEGPLVWNAAAYILYSRLAGEEGEARKFASRELPRLRRLQLPREAIGYIRAALSVPLSPEVRGNAVFLHTSSSISSSAEYLLANARRYPACYSGTSPGHL